MVKYLEDDKSKKKLNTLSNVNLESQKRICSIEGPRQSFDGFYG